MVSINCQISNLRELSFGKISHLRSGSSFHTAKRSYRSLNMISKMFVKRHFIITYRNCNSTVFARFTRGNYIHFFAGTSNYSCFCVIKIHIDFTHIRTEIFPTKDHFSSNTTFFRIKIRQHNRLVGIVFILLAFIIFTRRESCNKEAHQQRCENSKSVTLFHNIVI